MKNAKKVILFHNGNTKQQKGTASSCVEAVLCLLLVVRRSEVRNSDRERDVIRKLLFCHSRYRDLCSHSLRGGPGDRG